ncbi:hypothetical protein Dsin_025057 [Dipteronia sinensis]|uniref:Bifunctional inhibitor/plant lipid transfer protein/seed storage helical domain-containing protein n=1 Tax=Dipteronia sinensis TaxID=43782 RepID=A0AAD9ZV50_9ROSI|nr:hypothetical protein Dsin_025057 [Dipteronia sinensis]
MASRGLVLSLVLALVVVMLCGGAKAQAQQGCTNALSSLAPCLNYITGNSSNPSYSCCSKLGDVVQSSPQCVCSVLNGVVPSLGININQTLALSLPGACQVQTPTINQCKAASGPTTSATTPAGSPTSSPAEPADTPSASTVPSDAGTGSKTIPTTGENGTSDGSFDRAPFYFILFLLYVLSCASTLTKF